jgi:hypothetical protein
MIRMRLEPDNENYKKGRGSSFLVPNLNTIIHHSNPALALNLTITAYLIMNILYIYSYSNVKQILCF